jgi:hypothetical protein
MILLIVNLTVYILINKIELTNDYMRIRILSRNQLIPLRKDVIRLNVSDIKRILLGKENFLHETLKNNKKYIHEINMFYSKYGFRWYPTGVHSVSKNISMLVILTNDGQLSIASTNHFSKNNIRKLINELKKRNLNVLVG